MIQCSHMSHWKTYYQKTAYKPANKLLLKALPLVIEKGSALDIGAGTLGDSKRLLEENFQSVTAIDSAPEFVELAKQIQDPRFQFQNIGAEEYNFLPNHFDLISSQFTLPFLGQENFSQVWSHIHTSLKPGGIFCGQLFGEKDTWNIPGAKILFFSKEAAEKLLTDYEVINFEEIENDSFPAVGPLKHWHIFNLILRKP